jgi:anti-sigma factor RsiW
VSDTPVTEADIQAHADDRLPADRAAQVSAWLLSHPDEARRVASYRAQTQALRLALDPIADEPLPPALDLHLQAQSKRPRLAGLRHVAVAAGAAGLLAVGGASGWAIRGWSVPPVAGTAALAREAAASYTVYANDPTRPIEVAASQGPALDRWFSARLARSVKAPDLRAAGLTLAGGRLVATEHGAAGLYLYRDTAGRWIGLYMRPMKVDGNDRMTKRQEGAVAGWTWADEGLGFGVFGDLSSDSLHGAANIVRSQFQRT